MGHAITETWSNAGVLCPTLYILCQYALFFIFVQKASGRIASYKEKTGGSRSL